MLFRGTSALWHSKTPLSNMKLLNLTHLWGLCSYPDGKQWRFAAVFSSYILYYQNFLHFLLQKSGIAHRGAALVSKNCWNLPFCIFLIVSDKQKPWNCGSRFFRCTSILAVKFSCIFIAEIGIFLKISQRYFSLRATCRLTAQTYFEIQAIYFPPNGSRRNFPAMCRNAGL